MPWYKLSRTDCATVTHLYKLRPNTEQRHAIRTVRNIVKEHRWALHHRHVYMSMRCITSRKVCARRTALWGDYAGKLNMECSMPYRADLSQPYPSPTASKIFSPNPNESMSQLFILLTHLHTFLKNSLPLLNSSINRWMINALAHTNKPR